MQSSTIPNDQTQSTKSSSHCKIRDLTKVTDSRANNYKNVYLSGVQFILLVSFSKYTCQSHCIYRFQDMWKEKKRCSVKEKRPITNHTALWTLNFLKTQLVRGNSKKEALLFFNPSGLSPTCILLKESTSSATWQQLNLRQNSADLQAKQHFHMYYGEHHSNRNRPIGPQCLCRTWCPGHICCVMGRNIQRDLFLPHHTMLQLL